MKSGVAAALSALSDHDPSYTHAVVFDTNAWRPLMPPEGSQWDYEPFTVPSEAERRMSEALSERFAEPELWERRADGWAQIA